MNAIVYERVAAELRNRISVPTGLVTDLPNSETIISLFSSLPSIETPGIPLSDARAAIIDVLNGVPAQEHLYAEHAVQLLNMLVFCAHKDAAQTLCGNSSLSAAVLCCITEALLWCGWHSDDNQGMAKRAAHEYFSACRKMLHTSQQVVDGNTVHALVCAAFFAHTTDSTLQSLPIQRSQPVALFTPDTIHTGFAAAYRQEAPWLYTFSLGNNALPHPVYNSLTAKTTGLKVLINSSPLLPYRLVTVSTELREKISGFRMLYDCKTDTGISAQWSMGILFFKRTVYRIDHITFLPEHDALELSAELNLEAGRTADAICIRLLDNPLELSPRAMQEMSLYRYSAAKIAWNTSKPIHMVTAWAFGKDIDRTYLLGMYE
jgi:hypothetical protein